jgi:hypothetical protein
VLHYQCLLKVDTNGPKNLKIKQLLASKGKWTLMGTLLMSTKVDANDPQKRKKATIRVQTKVYFNGCTISVH